MSLASNTHLVASVRRAGRVFLDAPTNHCVPRKHTTTLHIFLRHPTRARVAHECRTTNDERAALVERDPRCAILRGKNERRRPSVCLGARRDDGRVEKIESYAMTVVDDGSARRGASRRRILDDGDPTRRALRIDEGTPGGRDGTTRSIVRFWTKMYSTTVRMSGFHILNRKPSSPVGPFATRILIPYALNKPYDEGLPSPRRATCVPCDARKRD